MTKGECNCGEIAYEIQESLTDLYMCHCSICRRSTGSGAITVAIVPTEKFSWVKGKENLKYWSKPGHDWHTNFCATCGSTLPGDNDSLNTYIPAGSLVDGNENLKVVHHLWVDSKASWEVIGDAGKQHPKGFGS
ncbi:GFA family protein [Microbulbifer sp. ZKSA004]|uniref:GFA family protein n=1 Tax=Microbulbifer sp. ZKSA004 TaxID=3243389 RepID=UPI00403995AC